MRVADSICHLLFNESSSTLEKSLDRSAFEEARNDPPAETVIRAAGLRVTGHLSGAYGRTFLRRRVVRYEECRLRHEVSWPRVAVTRRCPGLGRGGHRKGHWAAAGVHPRAMAAGRASGAPWSPRTGCGMAGEPVPFVHVQTRSAGRAPSADNVTSALAPGAGLMAPNRRSCRPMQVPVSGPRSADRRA